MHWGSLSASAHPWNPPPEGCHLLWVVTLPGPVLHPGATRAGARAKLAPGPPVPVLLQDVWCQPDAVAFKAVLKERIRCQNDSIVNLHQMRSCCTTHFNFQHKFWIFFTSSVESRGACCQIVAMIPNSLRFYNLTCQNAHVCMQVSSLPSLLNCCQCYISSSPVCSRDII